MGRAERVAAAVVIGGGLAVAWHAHAHLKLGMMISPGAGFLPFWVGVALVILGTIWLGMSLMAPEPAAISLDHPFLFFIRDNATGSVLFVGRVSDPS